MNEHWSRNELRPGWRDAFVDASVVLGLAKIRHLFVTNESRAAETDLDRAFRPCAIVFIQPWKPEVMPLQVFTPPGFTRAWRDDYITIFLPTQS